MEHDGESDQNKQVQNQKKANVHVMRIWHTLVHLEPTEFKMSKTDCGISDINPLHSRVVVITTNPRNE